MIRYMPKRWLMVAALLVSACTLSDPNVHEAAQCGAEWNSDDGSFDVSQGEKCELACADNAPDGWLVESNPSWPGASCTTVDADQTGGTTCASTFEFEGVTGCCKAPNRSGTGITFAFYECAP